jgi:VIT1/CCC1 family predicted Fe2+/Mn2+ transporter
MKNNQSENWLREAVFGAEDGMVSTLGALTGIAIGSQDQSTIILAGMVIIAVESISMGVGSYLANSSIDDWREKSIKEEKMQVKKNLASEKTELIKMFIRDGWPEEMAAKMAQTAGKNKQLLLKEMYYRELGLSFGSGKRMAANAGIMFMAYIVGGLVPLSAYWLWDWHQAWWLSIIITLMALFGLGVLIANFTRTNRMRSGLRVLGLGGLALLIGVGVGWLSRNFL